NLMWSSAMADDTVNIDKTDAASSSLDNALDTAQKTFDTAKDKAGDLLDEALAESKSFLSKAQETLANAAGSAVNAVKEHPIAAASIAAAAAGAVAGAAYGASKLLNGEGSDDDGSTKG